MTKRKTTKRDPEPIKLRITSTEAAEAEEGMWTDDDMTEDEPLAGDMLEIRDEDEEAAE